MKVAGALPAGDGARERAYALLQDPAILARCMPGCESLEKIGEDEYAMRMKMVMAAVSGKFDGKVRITDAAAAVAVPAARGRHGQDRLHEGRRACSR